jgi:hypothetical protein
VGLEDVRDGHVVPAGDSGVYFTIPAWIDYCSPATGSNQVRIMGEAFGNNPFKQHGQKLLYRGLSRLLVNTL